MYYVTYKTIFDMKKIIEIIEKYTQQKQKEKRETERKRECWKIKHI